jgi:hypothetical protein
MKCYTILRIKANVSSKTTVCIHQSIQRHNPQKFNFPSKQMFKYRCHSLLWTAFEIPAVTVRNILCTFHGLVQIGFPQRDKVHKKFLYHGLVPPPPPINRNTKCQDIVSTRTFRVEHFQTEVSFVSQKCNIFPHVQISNRLRKCQSKERKLWGFCVGNCCGEGITQTGKAVNLENFKLQYLHPCLQCNTQTTTGPKSLFAR